MRKTAVETQEELAKDEQQQLIDDEHWYLQPIVEQMDASA